MVNFQIEEKFFENFFYYNETFYCNYTYLYSHFSSLSAHEGPWTSARPDGHAPISVMGDHMHAMGEWMVSYRYMSMEMEGLLKGSKTLAPTMMATGFMPNMLPTEMTMDMHMFGTMYAISNKWTLMGMLNYLDNEMSMPMGKMDSSGLGDIKIAGLYDLAQWDSGRRMHLKLGLNLPTGSIDEKHNGNILGYGMQLGSGTYDFEPAITYLAQTENYSYGAQLEVFFALEKTIRIILLAISLKQPCGEPVKLLIL